MFARKQNCDEEAFLGPTTIRFHGKTKSFDREESRQVLNNREVSNSAPTVLVLGLADTSFCAFFVDCDILVQFDLVRESKKLMHFGC